jgi:hypothetical protein
MMASLTLETACRVIVDLRQQIKEMNGPGTPAARWEIIMGELEKRFPTSTKDSLMSSPPPELRYLEKIDKVLKDSKELNALKQQVVDVFFKKGNIE